MAPFSRKGKTARNLALAEAALALARDRNQARAGKRSRGKLLLAGGAVVAAGAAALLKRDKVAGLLPSRAGDQGTATPPPVPSQPSNYDAPGPVANTATPVPAPEPPPTTLEEEERPRVDEAAEEAAAAAEAANIGGPPAEYAGEALGEPADEAFRPLAEAGGGEAEGQEQAEADLAENATYRDAGMSGAAHQIEDAIQEADQPFAGETVEGVVPGGEEPAPDAAATGSAATPEPAAAEPTPSPTAATPEPPPPTTPAPPAPEPAAAEPGTRQESFLPPTPATPEPPAPVPDPAAEEGKDDDEPDDWRTWSGRAVKP